MGLLPGPLSPRLHEGLVRLGAWMPFGRAAAELGWFCGAAVGAATAARLAEAAGAAWAAEQADEAARLERERPAPLPGPPVQQVSADGAMVPLVGGQWAEVKTLAIGEVRAGRGADGEPLARTTGVSYFSRLADAAAFGRLALVETHARGTASAGTVAAVMDGAEWLQGFVDLHRPDAVRVLDFPHAVEHLNLAAQACFGEGSPRAAAWLAAQAHELKTGDPARVLAALGALPTHRAADRCAAAAGRDGTLAYLEKRRDQIAYARFRRLGLPIGSGMVESGHKNVVERRLKGPGMHWTAAHADAMAALRTVVCNDRWGTSWPRIAARLRARGHPRPCAPRTLSAHEAGRPRRTPRPRPPRVAPMPADRPKKVLGGRSTAAHPWRRRLRIQDALRAAAARAAKT